MLVGALLTGVAVTGLAQQVGSALYLPQLEWALRSPVDWVGARASLAYAQAAAPANPELPRYQVRLAQLEAEQAVGLAAWQARHRALRVLEKTLPQRPAWGQGWAYLALLRAQLTGPPAPGVAAAWALGAQLAPQEGLALPALCQVLAQQPSLQATHRVQCP